MIALLVFATFVAAAPAGPKEAQDRYKRLYPSTVTASSYLQNNWNKYSENYHPNYAFDDDPKTAWVEGVDGDGVGETLTAAVSPLASAHAVKLRVRNGYQKSKGLFKENAAPKEVGLALLSGAGATVFEKKISISRELGWQDFALTIPGDKGFAAVQIKLLSVEPGTVYKDTCLSDVEIYVDSSVEYRAQVELEKRDRLTAWITARREDAKYFARLPKAYPFAGTHFREHAELELNEPATDNEGEIVAGFTGVVDQLKSGKLSKGLRSTFSDTDLEQLKALEALAQDHGKNAKRDRARVAFKSVPKLPDGLGGKDLSMASGYLSPEETSYFETGEESFNAMPPKKIAQESYLKKFVRSNALIEWANKEKREPKTIYLWEHSVSEERSVYEDDLNVLLVFENGRLQRVLSLNINSSGRSYGIATFSFDAAGKIAALKSQDASYDSEYDSGNAYRVSSYTASAKAS